MLHLNQIDHIAIICSNYERSLKFYTEIIGCTVVAEYYREEQKSFLTRLALNGQYIIEMFSYPSPPQRLSYPEATGLRHLAFEVNDLKAEVDELDRLGVPHEAIRLDATTGKHFVFFNDPDDLPLEMYEK